MFPRRADSQIQRSTTATNVDRQQATRLQAVSLLYLRRGRVLQPPGDGALRPSSVDRRFGARQGYAGERRPLSLTRGRHRYVDFNCQMRDANDVVVGFAVVYCCSCKYNDIIAYSGKLALRHKWLFFPRLINIPSCITSK